MSKLIIVLAGFEGVAAGLLLQFGRLYAPYYLLLVAVGAYFALRANGRWPTVRLIALWVAGVISYMVLNKVEPIVALKNTWDMLPAAIAAIVSHRVPVLLAGKRFASFKINTGVAWLFTLGAGFGLGVLAGKFFPYVALVLVLPAFAGVMLPVWAGGPARLLHGFVYSTIYLVTVFSLYWNGIHFLRYSPYEFYYLYWPAMAAILFFGTLPVMGLIMNGTQMREQTEVPEEAIHEEIKPAQSAALCPVCGVAGEPGSKFCASCGSVITDGAPVENTAGRGR